MIDGGTGESVGIITLAYGQEAHNALSKVLWPSLERYARDIRLCVLSDTPPENALISVWRFTRTVHPLARDVKLQVAKLSPFDRTLYLDADTELLADPTPLFRILDAYPLALTHSARQGYDALGNCSPEDRHATFKLYGCLPTDLLAFQCGVMAFRRSPEVLDFFTTWYQEWARFQGQDQAAFLRSLWHNPLPVALLGRDWNGGKVIAHHFGTARSKVAR